MESSLKIYWETYFKHCSNEQMIHKIPNFLREYADEFIDGHILELECGQSQFLVEYSKTGREIFAVDNENFQLSALKQRIEAFAGTNKRPISLFKFKYSSEPNSCC